VNKSKSSSTAQKRPSLHCAAAAQDSSISSTGGSNARTAEVNAPSVAAFGALGALAAEFGSSAQQTLRTAAVLAVEDATAVAAAAAAGTVTVTEQHLLLAVLQILRRCS
jgi:hypothetical protein